MDSVVIVGGGVIGASLAYHLRTAPAPVALFERTTLGSGATAASMGVFFWQGRHPTSTKTALLHRACAEYEPLVTDGTLEFARTGALSVARTASHRSALEAAARRMRDLGIDARTLAPGEAAAHGVDPDAVAGAVYTPMEGHLDPGAVVAHYADRAADAGVEIRERTAVTGVRTADGAVEGVETTDGPVDADVVINAAGPWAPRIDAMAGVSLPLRHTRGPILDLAATPPDALPFTLVEGGLYVRRGNGTGAYLGRYDTAYEGAAALDPDADRSVDAEFREGAPDALSTVLPWLAGAGVRDEWVGLRTVTPDGLPILGETDVSGFHVACGPCGLGVTLAPILGRLLAERIEAGQTSGLAARLSPDRFDRGRGDKG